MFVATNYCQEITLVTSAQFLFSLKGKNSLVYWLKFHFYASVMSPSHLSLIISVSIASVWLCLWDGNMETLDWWFTRAVHVTYSFSWSENSLIHNNGRILPTFARNLNVFSTFTYNKGFLYAGCEFIILCLVLELWKSALRSLTFNCLLVRYFSYNKNYRKT